MNEAMSICKFVLQLLNLGVFYEYGDAFRETIIYSQIVNHVFNLWIMNHIYFLYMFFISSDYFSP